ncbi:MAG: lysylphosphatidylglycerol synthase transmembrane domain-containing protein [Candidatus Saccharibacteria bacterium]
MIKRILIVIAVAMTILGLYLSHNIISDVVSFAINNSVWLLIIALAVIVQMIGHVLRAKRTKLIIDQAASSSSRFQFLALSIGYLFNALLPLRLGEIVRALLVAKRLRISFLYTFIAVVIERMADVIFLSIIVIVGALFIGGHFATNIIAIAVVAATFSSTVMLMIILLARENKYLLKLIYLMSSLFNVSIKNRIRFKIWSLIFGLQSFFSHRKLVRRYISYALLSWLCYFISALIIVVPLLHINNLLQSVIASVSPYIISLPVLSPLDANAYHQLAISLPMDIVGLNIDMYGKLIWAVLMLPIAVIGIFSLFVYKVTETGTIKTHPDSFTNKLLRYDDISQEFPAFLDTYFRGHDLSRILHKIEVHGELSLVKFFKGGSDAITVLALKNGELFVKKIVPAEYTDRLRVQYKWLRRFSGKKYIVDVTAEYKTEDYYAIDLSYDPINISLFEYIHTHSLKQSKKVVDDVWSYVFTNVYSLEKEALHLVERDLYIEDRLINKMKKALSVNDDLVEAVKGKTIKINGETYDNFYTIFDKIKNNKEAWRDIATYRASDAIHGDLTIDNILINAKTQKPFIIDPSDDNQVRGPIIDFARHTQSLIAGYEFLNNDDEPTLLKKEGGTVTINYHDRRSARYMQLYDYLSEEIYKKYLTEAESKTVLFHTGLLFGRILAHRVVINPDNVLKYYAVSVVLLNKFYRQYDK